MSKSCHEPMPPDQLRLRFPEDMPVFADMCISKANEIAIAAIRTPDRWPASALCLIGPTGSGRTATACAWAHETDAAYLTGRALDALSPVQIEATLCRNVVIDDADQSEDEDNLLFALKRAEVMDTRLLLSSLTAPALWQAANADLRSRLSAMPITELLPPDEVLLKARLSAACRRRYIRLPDAVASYLARRMEHSYDAIERLAGRLDLAIEQTGRKPSIRLAGMILEDDWPGQSDTGDE